MPIQRILFVLVLGSLPACSNHNVAQGGNCSSTSQCSNGLFCESGKCAISGQTACATSSDCAGGRSCINKICALPSDTTAGVPTLTGVVANPDGTLTLTGTNLAGATSVSVSGGSLPGSTKLAIGSGASATQLIVSAAQTALSLVGGSYDFVVANAQGSATLSVSFTPAAGSVDATALAPGAVTSAALGDDLKVAFFAVFQGGAGGTTIASVGTGNLTPIVFDLVGTPDQIAAGFKFGFNSGAYDPSSGVFQAPATGVYAFNVTVVFNWDDTAASSHGWSVCLIIDSGTDPFPAVLELPQNASPATVMPSAGSQITAASSFIVQLNAGDKAFVGFRQSGSTPIPTITGVSAHVTGGQANPANFVETSFSGHRLY